MPASRVLVELVVHLLVAAQRGVAAAVADPGVEPAVLVASLCPGRLGLGAAGRLARVHDTLRRCGGGLAIAASSGVGLVRALSSKLGTFIGSR